MCLIPRKINKQVAPLYISHEPADFSAVCRPKQRYTAVLPGVSKRYVGSVPLMCSRRAQRAVPTISAATQESSLTDRYKQ